VTIAGLTVLPPVTVLGASGKLGHQSDPPEPGVKNGRWRRFRKESVVGASQEESLSNKQRETMRQLEALGYLQGKHPAPGFSGVTTYDPNRAWSSLNLYVSGHKPEAILMDMKGNVLHKWHFDYRDALPQLSTKEFIVPWSRTYMYEDGDLLAITISRALVRIDRNSQLKWGYPGKPHHDLFVTVDDRIYVLTREAMVIPSLHKTEPVQDDFVEILDSDGNPINRISILECFQNSPYYWPLVQNIRERMAYRLMSGAKYPGDIFHTNAIEVFDGSHEKKSPIFRKGNLLVSLREPGIVAVIEPETEAVVWATSGMWHRQHDPVLLENGRMLIFDNRGHQGYSRVIEFDPFTMNIHWTYKGNPPKNFFSKEVGKNQRLPNGNTLIVESDNGRALEVAPNGTIVWEFVNPHRAGENGEFIATLFDMVRIPRDWDLGWLEN